MALVQAQNSKIYDLLSPPLILVTPFISFINYNGYSNTAPEFWICVVGLVAIGLLCGTIMALGGTWFRVLGTAALVTLAIDLQFEVLEEQPWIRVPAVGIGMLLLCWLAREHLGRIIVPMFATMLVSTVALHLLGGAASSSGATTRAAIEPVPESDLPPIVHILLDEHIGIEGIPADVEHGPETKALLKTLFQSYGFRLFGHAYSRYFVTRDSVPAMLNYSSQVVDRTWVDGDKNVVMETNQYFEDMHDLGYQIRVFQILTVDFCSPSTRIVTSCYTQHQTGMGALEETQLPTEKKAILIYQTYARLSVIDNFFLYSNNLARDFALQHGWDWPMWWSERVDMGPLRAMRTLSLLAEEVARARPGQFFFAHLLAPHFSYVYDANCDVRDPADWENHWEPKSDDRDLRPPNTVQSRAYRYALYLEQVQCLSSKLDAMFRRWQEAGIFDRARIIIHGDHGSRIVLHRPEASEREEMLVSDYADAFSTLLAVKAPGYEPGYDLRWIAIQDLIPELAIHGHPRPAPREAPTHVASNPDQVPYVFLEAGSGAPMVKQPLPKFDSANRVVHLRHTQ